MTTLTATAAPSIKTRTLLGVLSTAGPAWIAVSLTQAATREGFDLTRHPLSALSTGSLGWLQITNFIVAGLLIVIGAVGLRRALADGPGAKWAPRLVAANGIGMIAAGIFTMDPGGGFPVGSPETPTTLSWHAAGHMFAGTFAFVALMAACLVLGRVYSRAGRRGHAIASRIAGVAVIIGNAWAMSGQPGASLGLAVGVFSGMLWVAYTAARLRR
ncbi:DUF998 domain-containing protein [Phytomonospora sp. NPDC050363]|uniref:DUF998 domain-containing protein n=1 Tax=Phytomonospora sp. NPDC050363 TaxID=3155642 RepID=UPI0034107069